MTTLERLQGALSALGLGAVEARVETLLERTGQAGAGVCGVFAGSDERGVDARRQRYLKTRLQPRSPATTS